MAKILNFVQSEEGCNPFDGMHGPENFIYRFLRSIGVQDVRFETAPIPEFAPTPTPLS